MAIKSSKVHFALVKQRERGGEREGEREGEGEGEKKNTFPSMNAW